MLFSHVELDPNESVVYEARKHWVVFAWQAVSAFLLAVLPLIIYPLIVDGLPEHASEIVKSYLALFGFVYAIWFLFIWIIVFVRWTNYYLDVWYITTDRIIDVDQKGIFHREVANLRFDRIQDVTVEVKGVYATFLKYGDLRVQTAAEDSTDYTMVNAADPEAVRRVIFEMHNKRKPHAHVVDGIH